MDAHPPDFHFARVFRGDRHATALARHQHYLFARLRLKTGMRVLHVGCGSGAAAIELASFENVYVFGVDTDMSKITQAVQRARDKKLASRVKFFHAESLEALDNVFPGGSFDAAFAIETLKGASSFYSAYQSIASVLRYGGRLAIYEWCWTPSLDPDNHDHRRLASLLELLTFLPPRALEDRTSDAALNALRDAHFREVECEDIACPGGGQRRAGDMGWYAFLEAAIADDGAVWVDDDGGPVVLAGKKNATGALTKNAAVVLAQAGRLQIFTPMAMLVARR
ncbi:S-adenosyl-L-methionine-dependent methyltransferase [Amylostereum chailletii]|nr:S-adenosyl-L-methionine-dependent methyltransferase [Amylostereum chailletii]